MKKTLIPHRNNYYRDSGDWVVKLLAVDYEQRMAQGYLMTNSSPKQYSMDYQTGFFAQKYEGNPIGTVKMLTFQELRSNGVRQVNL